MESEAVAAERLWFAVAPDGSEHEIVIRINVPSPDPKGSWLALVSISGLESRTFNIAGVDAWQAMSLAMHFVVVRVSHYAKLGWQFYWERGGSLASPTELANPAYPP